MTGEIIGKPPPRTTSRVELPPKNDPVARARRVAEGPVGEEPDPDTYDPKLRRGQTGDAPPDFGAGDVQVVASSLAGSIATKIFGATSGKDEEWIAKEVRIFIEGDVEKGEPKRSPADQKLRARVLLDELKNRKVDYGRVINELSSDKTRKVWLEKTLPAATSDEKAQALKASHAPGFWNWLLALIGRLFSALGADKLSEPVVDRMIVDSFPDKADPKFVEFVHKAKERGVSFEAIFDRLDDKNRTRFLAVAGKSLSLDDKASAVAMLIRGKTPEVKQNAIETMLASIAEPDRQTFLDKLERRERISYLAMQKDFDWTRDGARISYLESHYVDPRFTEPLRQRGVPVLAQDFAALDGANTFERAQGAAESARAVEAFYADPSLREAWKVLANPQADKQARAGAIAAIEKWKDELESAAKGAIDAVDKAQKDLAALDARYATVLAKTIDAYNHPPDGLPAKMLPVYRRDLAYVIREYGGDAALAAAGIDPKKIDLDARAPMSGGRGDIATQKRELEVLDATVKTDAAYAAEVMPKALGLVKAGSKDADAFSDAVLAQQKAGPTAPLDFKAWNAVADGLEARKAEIVKYRAELKERARTDDGFAQWMKLSGTDDMLAGMLSTVMSDLEIATKTLTVHLALPNVEAQGKGDEAYQAGAKLVLDTPMALNSYNDAQLNKLAKDYDAAIADAEKQKEALKTKRDEAKAILARKDIKGKKDTELPLSLRLLKQSAERTLSGYLPAAKGQQPATLAQQIENLRDVITALKAAKEDVTNRHKAIDGFMSEWNGMLGLGGPDDKLAVKGGEDGNKNPDAWTSDFVANIKRVNTALPLEGLTFPGGNPTLEFEVPYPRGAELPKGAKPSRTDKETGTRFIKVGPISLYDDKHKTDFGRTKRFFDVYMFQVRGIEAGTYGMLHTYLTNRGLKAPELPRTEKGEVDWAKFPEKYAELQKLFGQVFQKPGLETFDTDNRLYFARLAAGGKDTKTSATASVAMNAAAADEQVISSAEMQALITWLDNNEPNLLTPPGSGLRWDDITRILAKTALPTDVREALLLLRNAPELRIGFSDNQFTTMQRGDLQNIVSWLEGFEKNLGEKGGKPFEFKTVMLGASQWPERYRDKAEEDAPKRQAAERELQKAVAEAKKVADPVESKRLMVEAAKMHKAKVEGLAQLPPVYWKDGAKTAERIHKALADKNINNVRFYTQDLTAEQMQWVQIEFQARYGAEELGKLIKEFDRQGQTIVAGVLGGGMLSIDDRAQMIIRRGSKEFKRWHYEAEIEHQRDSILKYAKAKDDKYGIDVNDKLLKDYEEAIVALETALKDVPVPAKGEKQAPPANLAELAKLRAKMEYLGSLVFEATNAEIDDFNATLDKISAVSRIVGLSLVAIAATVITMGAAAPESVAFLTAGGAIEVGAGAGFAFVGGSTWAAAGLGLVAGTFAGTGVAAYGSILNQSLQGHVDWSKVWSDTQSGALISFGASLSIAGLGVTMPALGGPGASAFSRIATLGLTNAGTSGINNIVNATVQWSDGNYDAAISTLKGSKWDMLRAIVTAPIYAVNPVQGLPGHIIGAGIGIGEQIGYDYFMNAIGYTRDPLDPEAWASGAITGFIQSVATEPGTPRVRGATEEPHVRVPGESADAKPTWKIKSVDGDAVIVAKDGADPVRVPASLLLEQNPDLAKAIAKQTPAIDVTAPKKPGKATPIPDGPFKNAPPPKEAPRPPGANDAGFHLPEKTKGKDHVFTGIVHGQAEFRTDSGTVKVPMSQMLEANPHRVIGTSLQIDGKPYVVTGFANGEFQLRTRGGEVTMSAKKLYDGAGAQLNTLFEQPRVRVKRETKVEGELVFKDDPGDFVLESIKGDKARVRNLKTGKTELVALDHIAYQKSGLALSALPPVTQRRFEARLAKLHEQGNEVALSEWANLYADAANKSPEHANAVARMFANGADVDKIAATFEKLKNVDRHDLAEALSMKGLYQHMLDSCAPTAAQWGLGARAPDLAYVFTSDPKQVAQLQALWLAQGGGASKTHDLSAIADYTRAAPAMIQGDKIIFNASDLQAPDAITALLQTKKGESFTIEVLDRKGRTKTYEVVVAGNPPEFRVKGWRGIFQKLKIEAKVVGGDYVIAVNGKTASRIRTDSHVELPAVHRGMFLTEHPDIMMHLEAVTGEKYAMHSLGGTNEADVKATIRAQLADGKPVPIGVRWQTDENGVLASTGYAAGGHHQLWLQEIKIDPDTGQELVHVFDPDPNFRSKHPEGAWMPLDEVFRFPSPSADGVIGRPYIVFLPDNVPAPRQFDGSPATTGLGIPDPTAPKSKTHLAIDADPDVLLGTHVTINRKMYEVVARNSDGSYNLKLAGSDKRLSLPARTLAELPEVKHLLRTKTASSDVREIYEDPSVAYGTKVEVDGETYTAYKVHPDGEAIIFFPDSGQGPALEMAIPDVAALPEYQQHAADNEPYRSKLEFDDSVLHGVPIEIDGETFYQTKITKGGFEYEAKSGRKQQLTIAELATKPEVRKAIIDDAMKSAPAKNDAAQKPGTGGQAPAGVRFSDLDPTARSRAEHAHGEAITLYTAAYGDAKAVSLLMENVTAQGARVFMAGGASSALARDAAVMIKDPSFQKRWAAYKTLPEWVRATGADGLLRYAVHGGDGAVANLELFGKWAKQDAAKAEAFGKVMKAMFGESVAVEGLGSRNAMAAHRGSGDVRNDATRKAHSEWAQREMNGYDALIADLMARGMRDGDAGPPFNGQFVLEKMLTWIGGANEGRGAMSEVQKLLGEAKNDQERAAIFGLMNAQRKAGFAFDPDGIRRGLAEVRKNADWLVGKPSHIASAVELKVSPQAIRPERVKIDAKRVKPFIEKTFTADLAAAMKKGGDDLGPHGPALQEIFGKLPLSRAGLEAAFTPPIEGMHARLVALEPTGSGGIRLAFELVDKDGTPVATVKRTLARAADGHLILGRSLFTVDQRYQGVGISKMLDTQLRGFLDYVSEKRPGTEVTVIANISVGVYEWGKTFQFADPATSLPKMKEEFEVWLLQMSHQRPDVFTPDVVAAARELAKNATGVNDFVTLDIVDPKNPPNKVRFSDPTAPHGLVIENDHLGKAFLLLGASMWEGVQYPYGGAPQPPQPPQ
ncbi:MAG: hypothetical protein IT381_12095 [Deltaproteobacteria bacterium]|nr:hypothetical protein [Deltaproteobacteria bacterium]